MSAVALRPSPRGARGSTSTRALGLAAAVAVLGFAILLSIAVGARSIPLDEVVRHLLHGGGSENAVIVWDIRVPRTALGVVVGAALGVAGALMQALTRNPLADPGLLGVNAGAATAVVIALALGFGGAVGSIWFAFLGAAVAAVAVYLIGGAGAGGATPVRLALAGTALTAALTAVIYGIALSSPRLLRELNVWTVGALSERGYDQLLTVTVCVVWGLVLAALLARSLNAIALGDDSARALGARVGRTRILGGVAITILCGAATAAAGPIYFVGLTVPYAGRAICGPDQRWIIAYSAVLGGALLLVADVIGRVVVRPSEMEAGVTVALIGAPVFIALVRGNRISAL